ncbi:putative acetyltransferase and hydrolase with the alpha/beta hydrolase fold [Pseudomonas syringae pv. antirrhini]|uniref:Putative acetyltransferase and hydrolase with the alpha/beta hydrolase fold n=1 Tax=Pseudomonas syringae pv. antirrhini TaxID=251702 RepID=A0A0P9JEM0_9PSED|nr:MULTISPECIES: hypothetical protein [Pseudomonas]KPW48756.1 putative acetyltransferase and hydrolase with the alpha/beta hydrolase fold [Pseudomonas syringae pv. antirrhini]RMP37160.1 putative acetyltransferase and hydrolase with the alpha/beta hydrolase fold [Pseudomonas syringae pv. antirrhini]RMW28803.1 putative acetyltransferase and hydrolase with the alpha/beta hydrolase fold [Pseudomonas syringae pv. antirrhini]WIN09661.1 hypothetical protein QQF68_12730 [Pseudomonas syringae pv. antirr
MTTIWTPEGFDEWQRHFLATVFVRPPAALDWTELFLQRWRTPRLGLPKDTLVVLVAGLYSEFILYCNRACARSLKSEGYEVLRMPVRSSRGIIAQGEHIATVLGSRLKPGQRFVVLAHSKGSLDTLAALTQTPALLDACDGIALVQPPVGPSPIIDDVLGYRVPDAGPGYRMDRFRQAMVTRALLAEGTRDISSQRDPHVASMLSALPDTLHCVHVVSWSAVRRSRFDTHHQRLNAVRPGHAHDGQFYMQDLSLPGLPQICLPDVDHGQPILGGAGFDPARFWRTLLEVLHQTRPGRTGYTR